MVLPPTAHRWLEKHKLPTVILGTPAPDIQLPAVDMNSEATIRHAVEYLLRRGHWKIALLDLPTSQMVGSMKLYDAFEKSCALSRHRTVERFVETSTTRPTALESAVQRMWARTNPPTAIIVTNLELTIGLYTIFGQRGLRIPRDVSILCFYHWPILDALRPLPSCYKLSWPMLANRIVRMISEYQRIGVWPNRFWKLLPTLREGDSVARPIKR